ncbi:MAG: putative bifunctional diguanylate cyclase/phosphodiesterase [Betaproteobacteria bacterium]
MSEQPAEPRPSGALIRSGVDPASSGDGDFLRTAKIMMVDDEPITLDILQGFLEEAGYCNFVLTSEPREAVSLIASERPDVVMLDLMMPGVSGFDIMQTMRAEADLAHIPVIMLTSSTDAQTKLRALELGATDFLAKPVDSSELVLRLRNTLAAKAYLDRLTNFDRLTGLYNRQAFIDRLEDMLRQATRHGRTGALLHINLDRFKKVNEALGPALGDELLCAVAKRLEQCVRNTDTFARIGVDAEAPSLSRLGGDEFGVLLVEIDKAESTIVVAQRLLDALGPPFAIGGHEIIVTCSIGISVFPADGTEREIIVRNAATALQFAKQQGGNTYSFYSADLKNRSLLYLNLHSELRRAIDRRELRLFYQPKIETGSRRLIGAETLLRWHHPTRGYVSPGEFIPLAEETGLIVDIGARAFAEACGQVKAWEAAGLAPPKVAVNVSGRQFTDKDFLPSIQDILSDIKVDPRYLQIELTESMLMGNARGSIIILQQLKDLGLKLSVDDFGTGYSSLSYLRRFPIDELKIDQSFLADLNANDGSSSIVVAIIALAHSLGLRVVAEGVETEAQWQFLRDHGCDECQGYLFSKALPGEDFTALLVDSDQSTPAFASK